MAARSRFAAAVARIGPDWPVGDAAAMFARAGVPVFPCAPGGKQPITRRGFHDATTDLRRVQAWWSRFPEANIGVPTGAASQVVVVDVDVHGPVNGYHALTRAGRAGLIDGWEVATRSPSGGLHLYYPAADGTEQRSWQAGRAAIDFRGDGGYIIVPPSRRLVHGAPAGYRVESIADGRTGPVDARRLRDFLDPKPPPRLRPAGPVRNPGAVAARLAGWAARMPEGQRNASVFWAACKMAEHGIDPTVATDTLVEATAQPGFTAQEIHRTVGNAYRRTHQTEPAGRAGAFAAAAPPGPARAVVSRGLS